MSSLRIAIAILFTTFSVLGFAQVAVTPSGYATGATGQRSDSLVQNADASSTSLGEVARQYRHGTNPNAQGKVFTNADLDALHPPEEETFRQPEPTNPQPETNDTNMDTVGGNGAALPQSDQAAEAFDPSGKPSAGRKSVKKQVEKEIQQLHKK